MKRQKETCIFEIISKKIDIEWARVTMYNPDDIYASIPFLCFRTNNEDNSKIQFLQQGIAMFRGRERWALFKHPRTRKDNYIIAIEPVLEWTDVCFGGDKVISQEIYFGTEKYKKYCEKAIEDIPVLADFLENYYGEKIDGCRETK